MLPSRTIEYLNTTIIPKFLATQNAEGKVNVVPVLTMKAFDEDNLVFANIMIRKTKSNLDQDDRVSVCVLGMDAMAGMEQPPSIDELMANDPEDLQLNSFEIKGRFKEFDKKGKYYEAVSNIPMIKYSAYGTARSAGVIEVEETNQQFTNVPIEEIMSGSAPHFPLEEKSNGKMHPSICQKFNELSSFKVVTKNSAGRPRIIPVLSMRGAGNRLVFGCERINEKIFEEGEYLASSVLSVDGVAYQVKGSFEGIEEIESGKVGKIRVEEVYSASPPRPGERIDTR